MMTANIEKTFLFFFNEQILQYCELFFEICQNDMFELKLRHLDIVNQYSSVKNVIIFEPINFCTLQSTHFKHKINQFPFLEE